MTKFRRAMTQDLRAGLLAMMMVTLRDILITVIFSLVFAKSACADPMKLVKDYFLKGDYKQAISTGEKILAKESSSQAGDELYYLLGLSYLKEGNYLRAWDIFEIIVDEFKESSFKDEARVGIADVLFLRGEFDRADNYLRCLLRERPQLRLKAQALFRMAQIAFKKGDALRVESFLQKLRQEFPLSFEMRMSKYLSFPAEKAAIFHTVQVGSFSMQENARRLEQSLLQKGYPAYIEETGSSWRVRVGKLAHRADVLEIEKELAREGYPTKVCP